MDTFFFDVTDVREYLCCPRIVYYRYCLPAIRPITYAMKIGTEIHKREEGLEERRSLSKFNIEEGERHFQPFVSSDLLKLKGKPDMVLLTEEGKKKSGMVVEYKNTESKAGMHVQMQVVAYALLIEEQWGIPVTQGFIYSIPLRRHETIAITDQRKRKVIQLVAEMEEILQKECIPAPPKSQRCCTTCEFRRFCNDVV